MALTPNKLYLDFTSSPPTTSYYPLLIYFIVAKGGSASSEMVSSVDVFRESSWLTGGIAKTELDRKVLGLASTQLKQNNRVTCTQRTLNISRHCRFLSTWGGTLFGFYSLSSSPSRYSAIYSKSATNGNCNPSRSKCSVPKCIILTIQLSPPSSSPQSCGSIALSTTSRFQRHFAAAYRSVSAMAGRTAHLHLYLCPRSMSASGHRAR